MLKITLIENNVKDFEKAMNEEMDKAIKHFDRELVKIRTNRAHSSMVEDIMVSCYGQPAAPMKNVAAIAAPDARMITIQPWDAATIGDIEKAITMSDVGLTPLNDGKIIRLQLPEMSNSRREDLTKTLLKRLEECKITVRNSRKEFNNAVRDAKKAKTISENFASRLEDVIQKITDKYCEMAQKLSDVKEKEIKFV